MSSSNGVIYYTDGQNYGRAMWLAIDISSKELYGSWGWWDMYGSWGSVGTRADGGPSSVYDERLSRDVSCFRGYEE